MTPKNRFSELAAPGVRTMVPYQPGKPIEELAREYGITDAIKLASNENPLGPSPKAIDAAQAAITEIARYPDGAGFVLRSAIAQRLNIEREMITLGNGSNDILELIAHTFVTPDDEVIYSEYAFAVYPLVTQAIGARGIATPAHNYGYDLTALAAAINSRTKLIFIANPNNPTGTYLPATPLKDFIDSLPSQVIVVVDEAYCEYITEADYPNSIQWLNHAPNLIVTRTFSKAYGLAGLRVGYSVSHPEIADLLNRVRQPFNVNNIALAGATAALDDIDHLSRSRAVNSHGMTDLITGLKALGVGYIPSLGNFIAVDVGRPAQIIYESLLNKGVIVRPLASYGMPHHLRVSIGLPAENSRFLAALAQVLAG